MNKEVLLALIEKDINELAILNKGFSEHEPISAIILGLAKTKAGNILDGLQQLGDMKHVVQKIVEVDPVVIPHHLMVSEPTIDIAVPASEFVEISEPIQETVPELVIESIPVTPVEPEMAPAPVPEEIAVIEKPSASLAEVLNADNHSLNETLGLTAEPSLANQLSNSKIDDLRQSLSLAERFRFQRELFHGNGEKLNTTLSTLNGMKSEEDAFGYLSQFGWKDEDNCVADFKQLIHRKFV